MAEPAVRAHAPRRRDFDNKEDSMLVLTRRVGQQILVDDHIVLTICCITRNRVCVGIEAPPSVPVLRAELGDHPSLPKPAQHDDER
jgi:carbon storage regulator